MDKPSTLNDVSTAIEADRCRHPSGEGTADFESLGGHQLAEQLHAELTPVLPVPVAAPLGMRLPVLRETKMPAVLLELGPTRPVVDESPAVAAAVARALARWVAAPVSLDRG